MITSLSRPSGRLAAWAVLSAGGAVLLSGCAGGGPSVAAPSPGSSATSAPSTVRPAGESSMAAPTSSSATSSSSSSPAGPTTRSTDGPLATDPPRPTATDVVLGYATWDAASGAVLAGGYVSPVIEDGGTCTLVLTKGGSTVQATTTGVADATTTACGSLQVPRNQLTPGKWSAELRYSSPAATGHSARLTVEVPA